MPISLLGCLVLLGSLLRLGFLVHQLLLVLIGILVGGCLPSFGPGSWVVGALFTHSVIHPIAVPRDRASQPVESTAAGCAFAFLVDVHDVAVCCAGTLKAGVGAHRFGFGGGGGSVSGSGLIEHREYDTKTYLDWFDNGIRCLVGR